MRREELVGQAAVHSRASDVDPHRGVRTSGTVVDELLDALITGGGHKEVTLGVDSYSNGIVELGASRDPRPATTVPDDA